MFILKHSISVSDFALSYCTTAIDVIHALKPDLGFSARGHPRHDLGNRQGTELFKGNALLDIPLVSIVAAACGFDFAALLDGRGFFASLLLLLILFGISLSVRGF